jgi:hypothetical protein
MTQALISEKYGYPFERCKPSRRVDGKTFSASQRFCGRLEMVLTTMEFFMPHCGTTTVPSREGSCEKNGPTPPSGVRRGTAVSRARSTQVELALRVRFPSRILSLIGQDRPKSIFSHQG